MLYDMAQELKRYALHSIGIISLIIIICLLVRILSFSTLFLDPIAQTLKNFSFTDTYFYVENSSEEIADLNTDIVLFDISGCNSRLEIAEALHRINEYGPRVIGMDVIFGISSDSEDFVNDSLLNVISRCENLITACRIVNTREGAKIESSYFTKLIPCHEACINIEDGMVRHFSLSVESAGTELPTFTGEILKKAYPESYRLMKDRNNKKELINYKTIYFDNLHIYDYFDEVDIQDKVVLIGDLKDLKDYHSVPVAVDGHRRVSGTIIHGYALSTVTKNRLINQMGTGSGLVTAFIITFIFCVVCCWIFNTRKRLSSFIMNVAQLTLIIILFFIGGIIFIKFRYNINLLFVMLGIGLAGFCTDLWYFLLSRKLTRQIKYRIVGSLKKKKTVNI
jgi:CHASE2 domain-containing sensor protein